MTKNKLFPFLLAIIVTFLSTSCSLFNPRRDSPLTVEQLKEKGTLVVGTAITNPFEFYDPVTGQLVGFDIDVANYLASKLEVSAEFVEMPFASLLPALQTRQVDMTIAAMYIKPEREEVVDFATPYATSGLVMVALPNVAGKINSAEDLSGLRVGVKLGATGDTLAGTLIDQGINLKRIPYTNTADSLTAMENGHVDVVLNDFINTLAYLQDTDSNAQIIRDSYGDVAFLSSVGLGIAVHTGDAELLAKINQILEEMQTNGELDSLRKKWLGPIQ